MRISCTTNQQHIEVMELEHCGRRTCGKCVRPAEKSSHGLVTDHVSRKGNAIRRVRLYVSFARVRVREVTTASRGLEVKVTGQGSM